MPSRIGKTEGKIGEEEGRIEKEGKEGQRIGNKIRKGEGEGNGKQTGGRREETRKGK